MSELPDSTREPQARRVRLRGALVCVILAGALLGIWHAQMGGRAVFTFRNNEPYASWIGMFFGPLSTLPAVVLAMFTRRWSATWLVVGGLIALAALAIGAAGKENTVGEFSEIVLPFLLLVSGPMIALGVALVWIHHRLRPYEMHEIPAGNSRRRKVWTLILTAYLLVSVGALFVADVPLFDAVFETRWGFWGVPILLGPLAIPVLWRFIGLPIYLAESAIFLGLLWLAMNSPNRRRSALLGALTAWIISGLFLLSIAFAWS